MKLLFTAPLLVASCNAAPTSGPRRLRRPVHTVEELLSPLTVEETQDVLWSELNWFQRQLEGSLSLSYESFSYETSPPTTPETLSPVAASTSSPVAGTTPSPTPPPFSPPTGVPTTAPTPSPPITAPTAASVTPATGVPTTAPTPSPPIAAPTAAPVTPATGVPTTAPTPSPPIAAPTTAAVTPATSAPSTAPIPSPPIAAPTAAPVATSTGVPTTAPTPSPPIAAEPDSTTAPTLSPSIIVASACGMTDVERIAQIRSELSGLGGPLDDLASPQGKAFEWITTVDQRQLCPLDLSLIQRYVLAVLYYSTDGDNWTDCSKDDMNCAQSKFVNASNFLSSDSECLWAGIGCASGNLRNVELDANNLDGIIPDEIGSILSLRVLGLSENKLSGFIPTSIANVDKLLVLRVDKNDLTGTLPSFLSKRLVRFVVADNKLTGSLPSEGFGDKLRILQVQNNMFDGQIPSTLGSAVGMTQARFTGNDFNGTMPQQVCDLRSNKLDVLTADCSEVVCTCCTNCI